MACSSTLHYLLDIVQTDELSSMAKLAALTILNKLFISDSDGQIMEKCLKADITSSLMTALDLGLSASCDPADAVYVSVAMEVLSKLAQLSASRNQCLVTVVVVKRLLAFFDVTGPFYRFNDNTKDVLRELCQNRQLIGKVKVVAMGMEPLDYIHMHTKNKLKSHVRLPDSVKLCDMYDTESSEDLSVSQYFTQSGIAWQGSFPGDVVKDLEDQWQEIVVTEALDGGMFWGQVGEKCIKDINMIQQQLNCDPTLQRRDIVKPGDTVMVRGNIAGTSCFLRAQVMSSDGRALDVFAMDFGYRLTVPVTEAFCLPEQLGVAIIPRKISLCAVAGVQPKPYDDGLVGMAACILTSLCKQSLVTGEIICQLDGLETIKMLLQKTLDPGLTTQLVSLVHNMACNNRIRKDLNDAGIISCLLGIMDRHVEGIKACDMTSLTTDSNVRMALIRSIMALTNLMARNSMAREQFYANQGIDVIVQLLKILDGKRDVMYRMVVRLFRVFIGKAVIKSTGLEISAVKSQVQKPDPVVPPLSEELLHRVNDVQPRGRGPEHGRGQMSASKAADWDSDSEAEFHLGTESKLAPKSCHLPVHMTSSERYYRGSFVKVWDDDCHEICPSRRVEAISASRLAEHVCGMLNTGHEGWIYFGVDKERQVFGLELSREEKDRFRLGMDQIMGRKIQPVLLHSQFDIWVQPVYDSDSDSVIPDLYFIEICVRPSRDSIYTLADKVCYYRFGSETSSISRLELRQLIAIEVEAHYIDELTSLLQLRADLMDALQMTTT